MTDGTIVEYRVDDAGGTIPVVVLDAGDESFDDVVNWNLPGVNDLDLGRSLDRLRPGVQRLVEFVRTFEIESGEIEFGIELSTKIGAVIAAGEGKVNFKVCMKIAKGAA
jgi:hypothetical protein